MDSKKLQLRAKEKVIEVFRPESFSRRILSFVSKEAALIVTNQRIIYRNPPKEEKEIAFEDVYDSRIEGKTLNIFKRGSSLDYDYDADFKTFEMDKPYISVSWLSHPQEADSLIESFLNNPK